MYMGAPCGWTVEKCGCGDDWSSYTEETRERATTLATHFMWAATGRRYGLCEVAVMPCNPLPPEPLYREFPLASRFGSGPYGIVLNGRNLVSSGGCGSGCDCRAACELPLDGPVHSVVEVLVDGEPVDPTTFEVHNRSLLVRTSGGCWPTCNKFGSEIPGFMVTYLRGRPVPAAVQTATEDLACEYAKVCSAGGAGECRLPTDLVSLTRQGVEVTVAEVDKARGRLRTGIASVDDVLDADNPYGLVQAPTILSPDMPPQGRVVTWAGGS